MRVRRLAKPRDVAAGHDAIGHVQALRERQAGLRNHRLVTGHQNGDDVGSGIGGAGPTDERLAGIGKRRERDGLANGVCFKQRIDTDQATVGHHRQSRQQGQRVGRVGAIEILGEIVRPVVVLVEGAGLIRDAAEVGDFPRVGQAIAIRIEIQARDRAGDGAESVGHHHLISAQVREHDVGNQQ